MGLATFAFVVVLLAIIVPLFREIGYDTFDVEILSLSSAACCLAVALGWLDTKLPRIGPILFAVLIYGVADLYFIESELLGLVVLASCLMLSLLPMSQTFRHSSVVFCLIFLAASFFTIENGLFQTVKGSSVSSEVSEERTDRHDLRPIVHIVLDEFGSRLSVSRIASLRILNAAIERDYVKRGFAVFPATRATSGSSAISLSELVGPPGRRYLSENELKSGIKEHLFQVPENHYFAKLRELGYRIVVIQSSHLNFCDGETDHCLTYRRAEFVDAARRYGKRQTERLRNAVLALHAEISSRTGRWGITLYRYVAQGLGVLGVTGVELGRASDEKIWSPARMSLRVLDYLEANFSAPKPGHVYFAHVLLPHFPFVLDRNCNHKPPQEWRWPVWAWAAGEAGWRLGEIYAAYGEQLRCTHSRVLRLIDEMKKSARGSDLVFVIHGDHGPRIFKKIGHIKSATDSEAILSDGLDTFFAVKIAGVQPEIIERFDLLPARLQKMLETHISAKVGK